ncbi:MAG: CvpA family protein [Zetaproteobacteria bacterium]|nr:MAG: CvpA family protein [Zetaproteobacteria bacterium]
MESGFNFLDYALMAVVGVSMILAFYRGFIREAIALIGLVASFLIAQQLTGAAGSFLSTWVANRGIADILGFTLVFIIALIFMGLLGATLGKLMDMAEISGTDRGLGLVFGLARGLLLIAIVALIYSSYGKLDKPWLKESILAPYAMKLGELLGQTLPENCPLSRKHADGRHAGKTPEPDERMALSAIIEKNMH